MRISLLVLLLFAILGCGSGTETVKKQMAPIQLELGDPIVNGIGMIMVPIPAGEFQMGSPDSDRDPDTLFGLPIQLDPAEAPDRIAEKPQHLVKIMKPFYLSVHEVTQQQYEDVMGVRPWQGNDIVQDGPNYPAELVTYDDAVEFCRKLSEQEGVKYHLPTEAQWEYACRAGTTTDYSFGDDLSELGKYAWYFNEKQVSQKIKETMKSLNISEVSARRVGQKKPNPWGLYDMHGNVSEWCQDWYAPYGSEKVVSDPMGPAQGGRRVLRGGSCLSDALRMRSAYRHGGDLASRFSGVSFRVARTYP